MTIFLFYIMDNYTERKQRHRFMLTLRVTKRIQDTKMTGESQ